MEVNQEVVILEKKCSKCSCNKPLNSFYPKKRGLYGVDQVCKECDNFRKKQWYTENKSKVLNRVKSYYLKNKPQKLEYAKIYRKNNINKYKQYRKKLMQTNEIFKISCLVRDAIGRAFRKNGFKKNCKTLRILGCSFEELTTHLKNTWKNNYNTEYTGQEVHLDHIVPLSTAKTVEDVYRLSHYTNLQYLTPEDNYQKSDNLTWRIYE